ncbi:MAG TPA: hypothetical protein VGG39_36620 [Polyangiaceae bacterium]|jgi:hypothetical protein
MNPYAAPGTNATGNAGTASAEDDIAAASPPVLAKAAGGAIALAGGVVGLTGLQTMMLGHLRSPYSLIPWLLVALGLSNVVLGAVVFRARMWGALCATGATLLLALASGGWFVVSITHGLFSLYGFASPFLSATALVFAVLALGPCQRASAARARLHAQGMNLGI